MSETPSPSESLPAAPPPDGPPLPGQGAIVRDAIVLQIKLILEGLKDVILGPVALVAAAVDLVRGRSSGRHAFYDVVRAGRRFERWVNLYGVLERDRADPEALDVGEARVDAYFEKIERALQEEGARGQMTQTVRGHVDRWLDRLEDLNRR